METEQKNTLDTRGACLANLLCEKGFKARYHLPTCRVYLNGYGRDISAYFELDPDGSQFDPNDPLHGTNLKVWSNSYQSQAWLVNRCKQVKHSIMLAIKRTGLVSCEVCQRWEDVIL